MAGKKVIKAHRGFAHVPMRGRGRPPMRPPVRDPRRPQRDPKRPPIQQPIGTPSRQLTPEQRKRRIEAMQRARRRYLRTTPGQRKRQRDANIRRQLERGMTSGGQRITPQIRQLFEASLRQSARDRGLNFGNTKAFGLPDMSLPPRRRRRRPTGTPVPQQRRARPLPPTQQVRQAQPVGRPQQVREAQPTSYPAQEVRQAQQEPMQRPTGRRVAAKGKFITKKNIGANDYRQGGYVLSTVDNRKNKK
jgi:hypothetical protein